MVVFSLDCRAALAMTARPDDKIFTFFGCPMNYQEEELNPAPKNFQPSFGIKVAFFLIALLGLSAYGFMVIDRRISQKSFLEGNQMAAVKLVKTPLPNILAIDAKTGLGLSLHDSIKKWTLLNIWATWCAPCQEEMPSLELLANILKDKLDIIALSVDDDFQKVKEFVSSNNPSFKILWDKDKEISKSLDLKKYPETFLVSPDKELFVQFSGPRDWALKQAIEYLEKASTYKR
jgi:thiol-disulfide isomerase/thioredoxin